MQEIAGEETKAEIDTFENIYTPPELEEKSAEQPEKEQPAPAEPQKTEVSLDDVRKVLAEKSRMGYCNLSHKIQKREKPGKTEKKRPAIEKRRNIAGYSTGIVAKT